MELSQLRLKRERERERREERERERERKMKISGLDPNEAFRFYGHNGQS